MVTSKARQQTAQMGGRAEAPFSVILCGRKRRNISQTGFILFISFLSLRNMLMCMEKN